MRNMRINFVNKDNTAMRRTKQQQQCQQYQYQQLQETESKCHEGREGEDNGPQVEETSSRQDHSPEVDKVTGKARYRQMKKKAEELFAEGNVLLQSQHFDAALDPLRQCLRTYVMIRGANHVDVALVHESLAQVFTKMGEYNTAQLHYEAVARISDANMEDNRVMI